MNMIESNEDIWFCHAPALQSAPVEAEASLCYGHTCWTRHQMDPDGLHLRLQTMPWIGQDLGKGTVTCSFPWNMQKLGRRTPIEEGPSLLCFCCFFDWGVWCGPARTATSPRSSKLKLGLRFLGLRFLFVREEVSWIVSNDAGEWWNERRVSWWRRLERYGLC